MPRRAALGLMLLTISAVSAGCGSDASGVYVGTARDGVRMVQLVRAEKGKLTGRYEQVALDEEGRASTESVAIEGAVDGSQLVLTPAASHADSSGGMTGRLGPGRLELSAGGERMSLKKADIGAFEDEVKKLRARGAKIVAQREVEAQQAVLAKASSDLSIVASAEARIGEKLDAVRQRFAQMDEALRRAEQAQQSLQRYPDRGFQVGQIAAQAGAIRAERAGVHTGFVGLRQEVNSRVGNAATAILSVKKYCVEHSAVRAEADFKSLCQSVADQEAQLRKIVATLRPQFLATEAAYRKAT